MKIKSKFGGKNTVVVCFIFSSLLSCNSNEKYNAEDILPPPEQLSSFVSRDYLDDTPIVAILNPRVREEKSVSFQMINDGEIQIYGVGELIYNLADAEKTYFFKSDDTELFFDLAVKNRSIMRHSFVFSWADGKEYGRESATKKNFLKIVDKNAQLIGFKNKDPLSQKYISEVKIAWRDLNNLTPKNGLRIRFDIAIGDTDDYYVQRAKVAWNSREKGFKASSLGTLIMAEKIQSVGPNEMISLKGTPRADGIIDKTWTDAPAYNLRNVVYGFIKDSYDLSAKVKSAWNKDSLYFYVEVQDSQRKRIGENTKRKKQTMLDYGWIEDIKGNKIWEMHALDTEWAGGALKNHKLDTLISLKKGTYILKYSSDESHAWDNWDDTAPQTPFYGIIAYLAK